MISPAVVATIVAGCLAADSAGWNQWLGGASRQNAASFTHWTGAAPEFELAWRVPLGSGYSSVTVQGDAVATMMNDGREDFAIVLDATTGKERWRYAVGRKHKGHDGSIDGPLSTPALDDRSVYAINAQGRLSCLAVTNGSVRWEKHLKAGYGASEPHYGFASSPLLFGNSVIVEAGGSGLIRSGNLISFDRTSGELQWSVKSTLIGYSSPAAATLVGIPQVVSQAPQAVYAVNAATGEQLWDLSISEAGSWTPMLLPPDRILLSSSDQCLMIRLISQDGKIDPRVEWKSTQLGGTINPIVYFNGMIYGNHSRRLTALDGSTGELAWIERRDMFPILVGDFLVLLADRDGKLLIARPDAEEFVLLSEMPLYDASGGVRVESPMAFDKDMLYVRTDFALFALRLKGA